MEYGQILKRAWQITWNYKVLWLFGMFAIALAEIEFSRWGLSEEFLYGNFGNPYLIPEGVWNSLLLIGDFVRYLPNSLLNLFSFLASLIPLVLFVFSLIAIIGLIKGAGLSSEGVSSDWRSLAKAGRSFFWRNLGLMLILSIAILIFEFLLPLIAALIGVSSGSNASGWQVLILAAAAFIVFILDMHYHFVLVVLVTDELSLVQAISRTMKFIRLNLFKAGPMHFLLTFTEYAGGILTRLPLIVASYPIFISRLTGGNLNSEAAWDHFLEDSYTVLLAIAILIVGEAILHTFTITGWTLTYIELRETTGEAT